MRDSTPTSTAWLLESGHVAARALRFACIGVVSGAIYAAVTTLMVTLLAVTPVLASVAGYCASVPTSFIGHRGFSFRSNGHLTTEAIRFGIAQGLNILVTATAMHSAVATFHASFIWGMVGALTMVPLANFLLMNFWVFRDRHRGGVVAR